MRPALPTRLTALPSTLLLLALAWPLTACGGSARQAPPTLSAHDAGPASPDGRLLARTARLALEVDDDDAFEATLDRVAALAQDLGGHVVRRTRTHAVVKVPAPRLDEAVAGVGRLGEITDRWIGAVDVTADHLDLSVRIDNLKRLQARLRELVGAAQDVATVLAIEKELARVTSELERLEAQLRALNGRVALAELTVQLDSEVSPGPIGWVGYGAYRAVKWLIVWD